MAVKLWNMLKLIPSVPASRMSSMITGLARIDEKTNELILSLYNLPDPAEFISARSATYCAWFYDSERKNYKRIGELQRKNGLTFSMRKKIEIDGDGVFITVEEKGREPKQPGNIVLSSNTELFYQDLVTGTPLESATTRVEPIPTEELRFSEPVQIRYETPHVPVKDERVYEVTQPREQTGQTFEKVSEMRQPILKSQEEVIEVTAIEEEKVEVEHIHFEPRVKKAAETTGRREFEQVMKVKEPEAEAIGLNRAEEKKEEEDGRDREIIQVHVAIPKPLSKPVETTIYAEGQERSAAEVTERLKKIIEQFYSDLPTDEVMGMVKNRYQMVREELDLKGYWDKIKNHCEIFYQETRLKDLVEVIKRDLQYLAHLVGLYDLWEKIERLVREIVKIIDVPYWIAKAREWFEKVDINEWFMTAKKYVNAILAEIDPVVLWNRLKTWMENILKFMNIDEIIIWVKCKTQEMRQMSFEAFKVECIRLLNQWADAIKMPEIKIAVLKVVVRDKFSQVGNFFQRFKGKVDEEKDSERSSSRFEESRTENRNTMMWPAMETSGQSFDFGKNPYAHSIQSGGSGYA